MKFQGLFANERFRFQLLIFAAASVFGMVLGAVIVHFAFPDMSSINSMRWATAVTSLCAFALPALVTTFFIAKPTEDFLRKDSYPSIQFAILGVLSMFILLPFVNYLGWWNEQMTLPASLSEVEKYMRMFEDMAKVLTEQFLAEQTKLDLLSNILFMALIPAVTEELFFRGAIQRLLEKKMNVHIAVWVSAFIFSSYHMQFFGFLPRFILGGFLGYLFVWGKSIYLPILAHFVNNAILVIFAYLIKHSMVNVEIDKVGVEQEWWVAVLSLLITLPMIYYMAKKSNQKSQSVS